MADLLEKIKQWSFPWRDLTRRGATDDLPDLESDLPEKQIDLVRKHIQACLEGKGGEVSSHARAASLGQAYLGLNDTGRMRFLQILATDFGTDPDVVTQSIYNFQHADDTDAKQAYEVELRRNLEPARMILLRQFNALPQGVKFLVDLRADLMRLVKQEPGLKVVERDLKDVLISWFNVGFLELHRITWNSPASILEKIAEYEAVHSIDSWSDLKNRLARDRRLFAFFHPSMPKEPLIFVEVALVNGMANNVQSLLDEEAPMLDPQEADTAIFYSISNAQAGLAGISFGNFLIKKVVASLSKDLPNVKTFATLSPIPGFRQWLNKTTEHEEIKQALLAPDWQQDEMLKIPVMKLCAKYLLEEKRKGTRPLDPVAHFHLSNGARMERLNWMGDVSKKGMKQSAGMMINYLYKLSDIEKNHERYRGEGKIAVSSPIKLLNKG